jgi:hypothetical protein
MVVHAMIKILNDPQRPVYKTCRSQIYKFNVNLRHVLYTMLGAVLNELHTSSTTIRAQRWDTPGRSLPIKSCEAAASYSAQAMKCFRSRVGREMSLERLSVHGTQRPVYKTCRSQIYKFNVNLRHVLYTML